MKNLDVSLYLDYYGALLTEKQRAAARMYYNDDLSLAEIAENLGITRQAVFNSLKGAEAALAELEGRLRLAEKGKRLAGLCERALALPISDDVRTLILQIQREV